MAAIEPLRALHPDLEVAGPLDDLVAPPYDVIDPEQRERLAARSPHNIVRVDLPEAPDGGDRYAAAADALRGWIGSGALRRDEEPALWAHAQDYMAPDGTRRMRTGVFARVRVEPYGPGRVRPHERTHPGPREDRLALMRATRANTSPIFVLYGDPEGAATAALGEASAGEPWGEVTDEQDTTHRLWRIGDPELIERIRAAVAPAELLIADGHHRYETARVYAEEIGGEGDHRYVLACLVALEDPGLTVFPTHRLLDGLDDARREALRDAVERHFEVEPVDADDLAPPSGEPLRLGYLDAFHRRPLRLTLRDPDGVAAALPDASSAYRTLDTAVLETLVLKAALGMSDDDISHLHGLGYARSTDEARTLVEEGRYDAAFFMAPTPVAHVQAVAQAGESMPPKSTFFYPKLLTGLLLSPVGEL